MYPGPVCRQRSKGRDEGSVEAAQTRGQVYLLGTWMEWKSVDDGGARYVSITLSALLVELYRILSLAQRANMN